MVATDFNEQSKRTRTFKGFVQFQIPDGSTWYRLKERQALSVTFNFLREQHYSDAGTKALDPAGHSHTFQLRLKVTSDLFDDSFDGVSMDKKTLSYWIYKNTQNEPIDVVFVATMESLEGPDGATGEKYIHLKFVLDPSNFGPVVYGQGGTNEITIGGEVISITEIKRSSSQHQ
jgi:hypothetical protein